MLTVKSTRAARVRACTSSSHEFKLFRDLQSVAREAPPQRTTATMRKVIVALALGYARGDGHNGAGTSESPCISPTGATRRPWKRR